MASFTWQERAGIPNAMTLKPTGLIPLNPMFIYAEFARRSTPFSTKSVAARLNRRLRTGNGPLINLLRDKLFSFCR